MRIVMNSKRITRLGLLICCFACLGAEQAKDAPQPIAVDQEKRTVTIAAVVAPRKLATLNEIYPIEVIATLPAPKGQKAHETVVSFDAKPSEIHKALEQLGLAPGKPIAGEEGAAQGPELRLLIEIPTDDDGTRRIPIERTLLDKRTGKPMPILKWHFTGSAMVQPNPEKEEKVYGADVSGTLASVFPVTDQTVIQSNLTMQDEPLLKLETDKKILPPEGTPVKLIIQAK